MLVAINNQYALTATFALFREKVKSLVMPYDVETSSARAQTFGALEKQLVLDVQLLEHRLFGYLIIRGCKISFDIRGCA